MPKQPKNPAPDSLIAEELEIIETVDTYATVLSAVVELMEATRHATVRSVTTAESVSYRPFQV